MSYENLIRLQDTAQLFFFACLFGGLVFLLAGLVRPGWVRLSKRVWVIMSTVGLWLAGAIVYVGAIGYTHAQPNGPHSFESYMDGVTAQNCVRDGTLAGCEALKRKCVERDPTHPACRILQGEDPKKFYKTTVRRDRS